MGGFPDDKWFTANSDAVFLNPNPSDIGWLAFPAGPSGERFEVADLPPVELNIGLVGTVWVWNQNHLVRIYRVLLQGTAEGHMCSGYGH